MWIHQRTGPNTAISYSGWALIVLGLVALAVLKAVWSLIAPAWAVVAPVAVPLAAWGAVAAVCWWLITRHVLPAARYAVDRYRDRAGR